MGLDYLKSRGSSIFSGMSKALAFQTAKHISREDFLKQLDDTWLMLFSQSSGAIDEEETLAGMRKRIKKSGYDKAFSNAKITDVDLVDSFHRAIQASGKKVREVGK